MNDIEKTYATMGASTLVILVAIGMAVLFTNGCNHKTTKHDLGIHVATNHPVKNDSLINAIAQLRARLHEMRINDGDKEEIDLGLCFLFDLVLEQAKTQQDANNIDRQLIDDLILHLAKRDSTGAGPMLDRYVQWNQNVRR